eukprot:g6692.t1
MEYRGKYYVTFGPGSMGFGVQTPGDKEAGCVVNEVVPGTTAEKYGVEVGDTLLRIGDEDITHLGHKSTAELIEEAERPVVLQFERVTKANVTTDNGKENAKEKKENNNEIKIEELNEKYLKEFTFCSKHPFIAACKMGNLKDVRAFIKNNSYDVNATDSFGQTALYIGVFNNNIELIELLVDNGADVDSIVTVTGETSLGVATRNNNTEIVNILIKKGACINRQIGESGDTVLHRATYKNYPGLLNLFLNNGGDVNVKNKRGYTPLHIAARNDHEHIARFLIENGAHVNATDKYLSTPLHCAAYWGNVKTLKELLKNNGRHDMKNNKLMTVLDVAKDENRKTCTQLIHLYLSEWFYKRPVYLILKRYGDVFDTDISHLERYIIEYLVGDL